MKAIDRPLPKSTVPTTSVVHAASNSPSKHTTIVGRGKSLEMNFDACLNIFILYQYAESLGVGEAAQRIKD